MSSGKQETSAISAFGPPVAWAVLIFLASSIPQHAFPESRIFTQDKVIHGAVYAVLALLVFRGIRVRNPAAPAFSVIWRTILICLLYGALDELHQSYVPGRSCDVFDLIADVCGAGLAVAGALLWERRRSASGEA